MEGCENTPTVTVKVAETPEIVTLWRACQPHAAAINRGDMVAAPTNPWRGNLGIDLR